MEHFTPLSSLLGGVLIGLSASLLLLGNGRVAGISGILGGTLQPAPTDLLWRLMFIAGLVGTGVIAARLVPAAFASALPRPVPMVIAAGLLVGYGTRLGSGCTSGHGVCGISRQSPRSLVATLTFLVAGAVTVLLTRLGAGGAP